MKKIHIVKLVVALLLPLALGWTSGIFTQNSIRDGWYASLNRPSFTPSAEVFSPVWTVLYILMGISLYIVWKQVPGRRRENALGIFSLQLLLNFLWSLFFFYFRDIEIALIDIGALWISTAIMIVLFIRVKPLAGWLNIPYLLWLSFAIVLNAGFYALN